uniref:Uncharacterized protein n=1 Tax=Nelumbo nucifera TaxID=4432 RepID=A0A822XST6_NELNU|nr:TPA_asm: hypothetical protein HUJ06_024535 [Nelumbo nucifera]
MLDVATMKSPSYGVVECSNDGRGGKTRELSYRLKKKIKERERGPVREVYCEMQRRCPFTSNGGGGGDGGATFVGGRGGTGGSRIVDGFVVITVVILLGRGSTYSVAIIVLENGERPEAEGLLSSLLGKLDTDNDSQPS